MRSRDLVNLVLLQTIFDLGVLLLGEGIPGDFHVSDDIKLVDLSIELTSHARIAVVCKADLFRGFLVCHIVVTIVELSADEAAQSAEHRK